MALLPTYLRVRGDSRLFSELSRICGVVGWLIVENVEIAQKCVRSFTLLEPQSRVWDKLLRIRVLRPQAGLQS